MSSRGGPRGRGKGGDRGRGRGAPMELPIREGRGDFRGRGRGRGFEGGDRGRGGSSRGGPRGRGGFDQGPRIYSPSGSLTPPSPEVQKVENAVAAAIAKKPRKPTSYPERPGYGTQGQAVTLHANYFHLNAIGRDLYCYHVDLYPGSQRKPVGRKGKQIIRLLIEEHFPQFRNNITTDYKATLVSNVKILPAEHEESTFDVRYRDEYDDEYPEQRQVHRVKCLFTKMVTPGQLLSYLTSSNVDAVFDAKAEVLQAMDIVLGSYAKSQQSIASLGSNRHFAIKGPLTEKWNLGAGLEAYRGFFVSARAATARLLLNVQVKYVACYQEGSLVDVVRDFQRNHRNVSDLKRFLDKVRVRVIHITRKNRKGEVVPRIKAIAGLAAHNDGKGLTNPPRVKYFGAGPKDVEFFLDAPGQQAPVQGSSSGKGKKGKQPAKAGPAPAGRYISVADFFYQQYQKDLDPKLPVVNVGTRENPSYLPVEVCMVEPGQPAKAKLSPNQTRNMLNFAVRSPPQNAQSIVSNGLQVLGLAPSNPTVEEFGMGLDPRLITVSGRVLPAPQVFYKDARHAQKPIQPQGGSWNMKSIRFDRPTKLISWTWLLVEASGVRSYFDSPEALNPPLKAFVNKLDEIGVSAQPPKPGKRIVLSKPNFEQNIDDAVSQLMDRHKPTLILGILPFNDADYYNAIKRACDVKYGVININVLAERFREPKDQYIANVGLKFNLKLGGANQVLHPKELGIIGQGKTMLVGIDVTHPSPGSSSSAPSVAGMVASTDATLAQWPAELRIQASRQEMVDDLDTMLKAHLARWEKSHRGAYPENLIIYRDGVSEGQYETVLERELPLLKKACGEVYPATETKKGLPRISIMCVGKRHHTRFYPTRDQDADRSGNPFNGTVVDRGVTEARNWDFYLQAHTALKGTARPAHYFTLWDEIFYNQKPTPPHKNAADTLEALTHHLCYLFGRATKAVSICPPAYYADLVCTRARCYLSSVFDGSSAASSAPGAELKPEAMTVTVHPNVRDTMYYI